MRREELADAAERYILRAALVGAGTRSADALAPIIDLARSRFLGVGAEQYAISETEQSFERSTVGTMLVGKIEEQVDDLNYSTMIDILIDRRLAALGEFADAAEWTDDYGDIMIALVGLRRDLRESARLAATSAALMIRHIDWLVELGEYERRAEGDYVSQLAAECDEAGAPMAGSDATEIYAEVNGVYVGTIEPRSPETPAGLDAIVGNFEETAGEMLSIYGPNVAFVGVPEPEYNAGRAYLRALESTVADLGPAGDEVLASIRAEIVEDGFDERALREWFSDVAA